MTDENKQPDGTSTNNALKTYMATCVVRLSDQNTVGQIYFKSDKTGQALVDEAVELILADFNGVLDGDPEEEQGCYTTDDIVWNSVCVESEKNMLHLLKNAMTREELMPT